MIIFQIQLTIFQIPTTDFISKTFNHLQNMALPDEWYFTYLHRSLVSKKWYPWYPFFAYEY